MHADIGNCAKPILDAMDSFVYMDDKQVEGIVCRKSNLIDLWKSETNPLLFLRQRSAHKIKVDTEFRGE